VLAGHSNTERGFLKELGERLAVEFDGLEVLLSEHDRDPLDTV